MSLIISNIGEQLGCQFIGQIAMPNIWIISNLGGYEAHYIFFIFFIYFFCLPYRGNKEIPMLYVKRKLANIKYRKQV